MPRESDDRRIAVPWYQHSPLRRLQQLLQPLRQLPRQFPQPIRIHQPNLDEVAQVCAGFAQAF
ncbi:MAG: hypothetical protein KF699_08220 [Phycisphaeraceae bacterium]|nr:hypothetical protein [Phycisphaeraceae bacterium]MBX3406212.1 hypothetical protein [Phycisphaeraceae bacterium]